MRDGVAPTRCVGALTALFLAWNLALPGRAAEVEWRRADYLVLAEHSALGTSRALTDALDARGVGYRTVVLPAAGAERVLRDRASHRTARFHALLAVGPCAFGADAAPRSIWSGLSLPEGDVDALLAAQDRRGTRLLRICSDWGSAATGAGRGQVASLLPDRDAADRSSRLLLSLGFQGLRHRAGIRPHVLAAAQGALRLTPLRLRFNDSAVEPSGPTLFRTASAMAHAWDVGGGGDDGLSAAAIRAQRAGHPAPPGADGVVALTGRDSDGRRFALLSFAAAAGLDSALPAPGDEALALLLTPALRWLAAGAYAGVHRMRLAVLVDDALAPAPTATLDGWGSLSLRLNPAPLAPPRSSGAWPATGGDPAVRWASPGSLPQAGDEGANGVTFPSPAAVASLIEQAAAAQRPLAEALGQAGDGSVPSPFVTLAADGAWLRNATPAIHAAPGAGLLGWALYADLASPARALPSGVGGPRGDALDSCITTARTVAPDAPLSVPELLHCALSAGRVAAHAAGDLLCGRNATVALPCADRWGGPGPALRVEQALGAFLAASAPNANATVCGEEVVSALRAARAVALASTGPCGQASAGTQGPVNPCASTGDRNDAGHSR